MSSLATDPTVHPERDGGVALRALCQSDAVKRPPPRAGRRMFDHFLETDEIIVPCAHDYTLTP